MLSRFGHDNHKNITTVKFATRYVNIKLKIKTAYSKKKCTAYSKMQRNRNERTIRDNGMEKAHKSQ